ncbi:MAG TPA: sigma-70 family RNA polymerase sigma factor [Niabella sp.]|nr:sigma-70 family RNA polymerase sigma factor [Niabella sp.]HOZ98424.1 sigma-70 family RNA polymerase sigma factor [Niabella sp.]HQW16047.1 sigma-70 family RNA polymerase sigma factor [Niabella sp.]HQX21201.1 sigma-70 family RNA polymerase sigma factor [Niabella sp.]HQX42833.1 sigma-70 family RNA polymerase sigma factor [Niabella sp.]
MTVIKSYYEKFNAKFIAIACHFGLGLEEAKDTVQQFFLELIQKELKEDIRNPEAFLRTAFKRKLIDQYRSKRKTNKPYNQDAFDVPSTQEILERIESDSFLIDCLAEAYKSLPARCRRVIYLKYHNGYTTKDIAKHTGLTEQNVYNNLSKGIQMLRKAMNVRVSPSKLGGLLSLFF